jgi:hypothetical protein
MSELTFYEAEKAREQKLWLSKMEWWLNASWYIPHGMKLNKWRIHWAMWMPRPSPRSYDITLLRLSDVLRQYLVKRERDPISEPKKQRTKKSYVELKSWNQEVPRPYVSAVALIIIVAIRMVLEIILGDLWRG